MELASSMLGEGWRSRHVLWGGAALTVACAVLGLSLAGNVTPPALAQRLPARSLARDALPVPSAKPREEHPACSAEMALVEHTCVDRYEAHLLVSGPDGKLVLHPPETRPDAGRFIAASAAGVKPQAFISRVEAASACENAGKRLCGVSEWYRACTGAAHTTYPYGAHYQAGRCNVAKPHLLSMLHGASVSGWSYADFNDPKLALTPGFLAPTGQYSECKSTEGVFDMVGNLHEWVADPVDATLAKKLPVPAVTQHRLGRHPGNGIFMGGFFSTLNQHGSGCEFATTAHAPSYHDYSTGFRCCKDSDEATDAHD